MGGLGGAYFSLDPEFNALGFNPLSGVKGFAPVPPFADTGNKGLTPYNTYWYPHNPIAGAPLSLANLTAYPAPNLPTVPAAPDSGLRLDAKALARLSAAQRGLAGMLAPLLFQDPDVGHGRSDPNRSPTVAADEQLAATARHLKARHTFRASPSRLKDQRPRPVPDQGRPPALAPWQIGNIIFNETASLSGPGVARARRAMAHAIANADKRWGPKRSIYARTAPTEITRKLSPHEQEILAVSQAIAIQAALEQEAGIDPTNGAIYFNRRNSSSKVKNRHYHERPSLPPFGTVPQ